MTTHPITTADDLTPGFHIFPGEDGGHFWHLVAANGQVLAVSQSYSDAQAADRGIFAAKRAALEAMGIADTLQEFHRQVRAAEAHNLTHAKLTEQAESEASDQRAAEQKARELGAEVATAILPVLDPAAAS